VVLQPGDVPTFLFAVSEFAIALLLLALNGNHRATRAFALLIAFRGITPLSR
jgi:hypothetical protein